MTVREVVALAKVRLANLAIAKNEEVLTTFLNLGLEELYRRFNLSIRSETIATTPDLALYELRNEDVQLLIAVYDKYGIELRQSDVLDSVDYDYKLVNYRSFLLRKPKNDYLFAVYKASPIYLVDGNDVLDIPNTMINALLTYIAYLANSTINRDNQQESSNQYQIFTQQCSELEMQGYKIPITSGTPAVQAKGFV